MIQMVGSTRGTPEGFSHGQASGSQQPPPPPPNLVEVMALQTELLRQLVQGQQNQPRSQQWGCDDHIPLASGYQDFFGTHPPLFHRTDEPLDADAWLRTIESKFVLLPVPCSEANKTLFAAQQLRGTARIRWDNYRAMLPADYVVNWEEFRTAFRVHHIPEGLLDRKLNEFLSLTQGNRTVLQYIQVFNHLCQYAGHHVDTDAKKQDHFRHGLNTKLKECLNLVRPNNYNELINMAITQDDYITVHRAEKKTKAPTGPSGAQSPRYRLVQNIAPKAPSRNAPSGRWIFKPPQQQGVARPPMPQQQQSGPRPSFQ